MGLDMYLRAERFVWYNEEDTLGADIVKHFPELPEGCKVKTVEVEVGYWRKANAVHKWFVDHVQDGEDACQKSFVSKEDIQKLRDECQKVLDNPDIAANTLPTQSGFFFGGTDYDEWYLKDLRETVVICNRAIALPDNWDLYYQSSW